MVLFKASFEILWHLFCLYCMFSVAYRSYKDRKRIQELEELVADLEDDLNEDTCDPLEGR